MKRILCLVLCFLMILPIFASCSGKKGEIQVKKKTETIDLTDYALVYAADTTAVGRQHINELSKMIRDSFAISLQYDSDENAEPVEKEILIGNTNRKETAKALKKVKGEGWIISLVGEKIVIAGTSQFLTRAALSYFINNYAPTEKSTEKSITINTRVLLSGASSTTITPEDGNLPQMLYSKMLDDKLGEFANGYSRNPETTGGMEMDEIPTMANEIVALLASSAGFLKKDLICKDETAPESDVEFIFGKVERDVYMNELRKIGVDEYGISIVDGKVMLLGWEETALQKAKEELKELISNCMITDESGNKTLVLPTRGTIVRPLNKLEWAVDFPKPAGVDLHGAVDVGDNSLEYVYSGDGVNYDNYKAYCATLEADGYTMIAAENSGEGNYFRTYVNDKKGITLHVYLAAYNHVSGLEYGGNVLRSIRIVAAYTKNVTVPDADILSQKPWTKICESRVISPRMDKEGMCYVIQLEDGSFFMLDGGSGSSDDKSYDYPQNAQQKWDLLYKLHTEAHGQAPSAEKPIKVRAWYLSHQHGDHVGFIPEFMKLVGSDSAKRDAFDLDYVLFNSISKNESVNAESMGTDFVTATMMPLKGNFKEAFKYIKIHTGQVFYFANLKVEVMNTHEDIYPAKLEEGNSACSAIRTTITSTDGSKRKETTAMWLGDSTFINSRTMQGMWGNALKSDMCQQAHHGSLAVERSLYDCISPEFVWFPGKEGRYNQCMNPNTNDNSINGSWYDYWCYKIDRYVITELASVKHVVFYNNKTTYLTLSANDVNYENLRDLDTGSVVSWQKPPATYQGFIPYVKR